LEESNKSKLDSARKRNSFSFSGEEIDMDFELEDELRSNNSSSSSNWDESSHGSSSSPPETTSVLQSPKNKSKGGNQSSSPINIAVPGQKFNNRGIIGKTAIHLCYNLF
jgi:hypothetical protein